MERKQRFQTRRFFSLSSVLQVTQIELAKTAYEYDYTSREKKNVASK